MNTTFVVVEHEDFRVDEAKFDKNGLMFTLSVSYMGYSGGHMNVMLSRKHAYTFLERIKKACEEELRRKESGEDGKDQITGGSGTA